MKKLLILYLAIFSLREMSASCPGFELLSEGNLTCNDQLTITDTHNKLRSIIAAGKHKRLRQGVNILQMFWDERLLKYARKWTKNCTFLKNILNPSKEDRILYAGMNFDLSISSHPPVNKPNFEEIVQKWHDDLKNYKGPFHLGGSSFVKLSWGDTKHVACSYATYKYQGNEYITLFVCAYDPHGDIWGSKPYSVGRRYCTKMNLKFSTTFDGLCIAQTDWGVDQNCYTTDESENNYTTEPPNILLI